MSDDQGPRLSEADEDDRKKFVEYITARWSQFASAMRDARQDAAKYIGVVNAGGAATMLTFLGALLKDRTDIAGALTLKLALLSFAVGVGFCAIAHAVGNVHLGGLFKLFRADVMLFYDDQIGFDKLRKDDADRAEGHNPFEFFIWGGLILFLVGIALSVRLLFES